jgi:hypothetical protein
VVVAVSAIRKIEHAHSEAPAAAAEAA